MRLFLMMEVVLALALGLAVARIVMADLSGYKLFTRSMEVANAILAGFVLVLGMVTWLEAARRRTRVPWGPGRRTWSAILAYLLLNKLFGMGLTVGYTSRHPGSPSLPTRLVDNLVKHHVGGLLVPVATGILAVGLTRLLCQTRPEPEPDPREWILRIASALTVATYLGIEILGMATI